MLKRIVLNTEQIKVFDNIPFITGASKIVNNKISHNSKISLDNIKGNTLTEEMLKSMFKV